MHLPIAWVKHINYDKQKIKKKADISFYVPQII